MISISIAVDASVSPPILRLNGVSLHWSRVADLPKDMRNHVRSRLHQMNAKYVAWTMPLATCPQ